MKVTRMLEKNWEKEMEEGKEEEEEVVMMVVMKVMVIKGSYWKQE